MTENLIVLDHPILQNKLGILRNKKTHAYQFRGVMTEISRILAYEISHDFKTQTYEIETPIQKTTAVELSENPIIIPILRAGLGMVDGILSMLPSASVGHVGIYRDKFINYTVEYYFRLPKHTENRRIIIVDPLIATADTMLACIARLKQFKVGDIHLVCLLLSRKGYEAILEQHPDVKIYCLGVEEDMNEQGYLVPGIGDVGDRLYKTEV